MYSDIFTKQDLINISRSSTDEEIFIIGGGEIYKLGLEFVDKLYNVSFFFDLC